MITYTYAAPPIGNEAFVDANNDLFNMHRVYNTYDVVPNIGLLQDALKTLPEGSPLKNLATWVVDLNHIGKPYGFISNETLKNKLYSETKKNYDTDNLIDQIKNLHSTSSYRLAVQLGLVR